MAAKNVRLLSPTRAVVLETYVYGNLANEAGSIKFKEKEYTYSWTDRTGCLEFIEAGKTLSLTPEGGVA